MSRREPKPTFWDYLSDQSGRDDAVGELARLAQSSSFAGSSTFDIWDHLEELGVMDESGVAMRAAESEYNIVVLKWEDRIRSGHRAGRVLRGGLPGLGRRR